MEGQHAARSSDRVERMELVGRYRIVEIGLDLFTDDPWVFGQMRRFLEPFEHPCRQPARYVVRTRSGSKGFVVTKDGREILYPEARDLAVRALLWHWNTEVMQQTTAAAAIHAGAVCLGSRAVVLPGDSGAGKSTLVGALITEGFDYLSDEGALLTLDDQTLVPYPRPLSLDMRSIRLLGMPCEAGDWTTDERLVRPEDVRAGCVAAADATVSVIAFVSRVRHSQAGVEPIRKAEAVRMLADRTPNLAVTGERGFLALAGAVAQAVTIRVSSGDPRAAARLLRAVVNG